MWKNYLFIEKEVVSMAYQKTQWVNGLTPVNDENLNKIEQGVYQNSIDIETIDVTTQVNSGIAVHNMSNVSHDDLRKGKIDKTQIKNTLSETVAGNVLDATQGKVLNDRITMKSDKTYVDNQDSVINNKVGDTTTLTTTDKTSTVAAINELDSEISILSSYVNKLSMLNGWDTLLWNDESYTPRVVVAKNLITVSGMIVGGTTTINTILCELGLSVFHRRFYLTPHNDARTSRQIYISPSGQVKISDTRGFEQGEIYYFNFSLVRRY